MDLNQTIDGSYNWNQYDKNGTLTVEPAYYRPLLEFSAPMNDPRAPGWGSGTNGVAIITQNSAVICASTASGARLPVVGNTIVFPYQTGGVVTRTVSSTAGSCGSGSPFTLSSALPNTAGYTAAQAEWWQYTSAQQTLGVAIPATITLPYTIQLSIPFPPTAGSEANLAPHGHIRIGNDEWDYMGVNFGGTGGGNPTMTLRNGPTSVNGGAGDAIGTTVFPLNPCQAMLSYSLACGTHSQLR